jgi:hypothetical protein
LLVEERLQRTSQVLLTVKKSSLWRQHSTCVNFHRPVLMSFARSLFTQFIWLCQSDTVTRSVTASISGDRHSYLKAVCLHFVFLFSLFFFQLVLLIQLLVFWH